MNRRTAGDVLDRDFLETRAKILALAAALDRLDRAGEVGPTGDDGRLDQLRRGLDALRDDGPGRAERVQLIFSDPYVDGWRDATIGPRA